MLECDNCDCVIEEGQELERHSDLSDQDEPLFFCSDGCHWDWQDRQRHAEKHHHQMAPIYAAEEYQRMF